MTVYSGRDRKCATPWMTAADATVAGHTAKTENCGRQIVHGQLIFRVI
jgi:hypothetical protein